MEYTFIHTQQENIQDIQFADDDILMLAVSRQCKYIRTALEVR